MGEKWANVDAEDLSRSKFRIQMIRRVKRLLDLRVCQLKVNTTGSECFLNKKDSVSVGCSLSGFVGVKRRNVICQRQFNR